MSYQIMMTSPIYDNRDACVGTRTALAVENTYETANLAHRLAGKFCDECWGEVDFFVVEAGTRNRAQPSTPAAQGWDDEDIPY